MMENLGQIEHVLTTTTLRGSYEDSCAILAIPGLVFSAIALKILEAAIVYLRSHAESSDNSAYSAQADADIIYDGPLFANSPPQG